MALGGGTFVTQNKVLPGSYINFVSRPRALGSLGERGTVAIMLDHNWGEEENIVTVEVENIRRDSLNIFGYLYTDAEMLYIRELCRGAKTIKFFRAKSGAKATAKLDELTITANHGGTRGNHIKVLIEERVDDPSLFEVVTYISADNIEVDRQRVSDIKDLVANDFVNFKGEGVPTETAGINLLGGTDRAITGNDYSIFLDTVEAEDFTTLIYVGEEEVTKALFDSFTKRLRDDEGYKITTVLHNYTKADFEGVISVKNNVNDSNKNALVYWVGGQIAGAEVNESLTNKIYDGELEVDTRYKKSEFIKDVETGQFALYGDRSNVRVLKDINTFTSVDDNKNADFSNNQIIRVLDEISNGTARIFDDSYLGKVQNEDIGRDLFKAELINYHDQLQAIRAITNFRAEDIEMSKGDEKGDVLVNVYVEPVGAMDKLYMTVKVI